MLIRIGLDNNGQAHFWNWNYDKEDYDEEKLSPEEAMIIMSSPLTIIELAWLNPKDPQTHNWEVRATGPTRL